MQEASFELSPVDHAYLASKGYDLDDLRAWSCFITESDSDKAVAILEARVQSRGHDAFPLPVLSYFSRRDSISGSALQPLIDHISRAFADARTTGTTTPPNVVFMMFAQLLRHAGRVLPAAIETATGFLLDNLPSNDELSVKQLQNLTLTLNRAMSLISIPTSLRPFEDSSLQEVVLVRVLHFMTEHKPHLHINREGYRAVVGVQLRQAKTPDEGRWAQLKALSWPPWKQDRTDLDRELTPEHGISKAGKTLIRMTEAGYRLESADVVAQIYSGWNDDGTPTVQTRHLLSRDAWRDSRKANLWAARIRTTRTIQEAWACYLAYEGQASQLDHDVVLAVFEKLHQEDLRKQRVIRPEGHRVFGEGSIQLLPGDGKEVSPLPPSTHLYTYTKSEPPSVHTFFTMLEGRGHQLSWRCGSFIVGNAFSLQHGYQYLTHLERRLGGLTSLIAGRPPNSVDTFPKDAVTSIIQLLCRFSAVPLSKLVEVPAAYTGPSNLKIPYHLSQRRLNTHHPVVRVVWLLQQIAESSRYQWEFLYRALGKYDTNLSRITLPPREHIGEPRIHNVTGHDLEAVLAHRFAEQLLGMMRNARLDVDPPIFRRLCVIAENCAIASYRVLRTSRGASHTAPGDFDEAYSLENEVRHVRRQRPEDRIEGIFRRMVGEKTFDGLRGRLAQMALGEDNAAQGSAALLERPGPAYLHAYIRALGFHGAHEQLLTLVKWMRVNCPADLDDELGDASDRLIMRRAVVALRVFLERNWMIDGVQSDRGPDAQLVSQFERPAPPELIREVRGLIEDRYGAKIGGWASDGEVQQYCQHESFRRFLQT